MAGAFRPDVTLPGLRTDKPDWLQRLRALAATGHIDQTDADQLAHFAEHGWLLMERAIEPERSMRWSTTSGTCTSIRVISRPPTSATTVRTS